jgi:hypothetical protein
VPLCLQRIPHGLTRDQTRASAVGGRRLTAWAIARPTSAVSISGETLSIPGALPFFSCLMAFLTSSSVGVPMLIFKRLVSCSSFSSSSSVAGRLLWRKTKRVLNLVHVWCVYIERMPRLNFLTAYVLWFVW